MPDSDMVILSLFLLRLYLEKDEFEIQLHF